MEARAVWLFERSVDSPFLRATIALLSSRSKGAFMTVSDTDRRDDKRQTLCLMLALAGDGYLTQAVVKPTAKEFDNVLPTTWRELLDDGLIDDKFSSMQSPAFRLTSAGWLRAMLVSGTADTPECRD